MKRESTVIGLAVGETFIKGEEMEQQALGIEFEERKVMRTIEVKFQPHEHKQLLEDIVGSRRLLRAKEDDFTLIKKQYNSEVSDLEAGLNKVIDMAEKGTRPENVECTEKRFFNENKIQVWNGDELVEDRAMGAEERQGMLFDQGKVEVLDAEEEDEEPMTPAGMHEDIAGVIADETNRHSKSNAVDGPQ